MDVKPPPIFHISFIKNIFKLAKIEYPHDVDLDTAESILKDTDYQFYLFHKFHQLCWNYEESRNYQTPRVSNGLFKLVKLCINCNHGDSCEANFWSSFLNIEIHPFCLGNLIRNKQKLSIFLPEESFQLFSEIVLGINKENAYISFPFLLILMLLENFQYEKTLDLREVIILENYYESTWEEIKKMILSAFYINEVEATG